MGVVDISDIVMDFVEQKNIKSSSIAKINKVIKSLNKAEIELKREIKASNSLRRIAGDKRPFKLCEYCFKPIWHHEWVHENIEQDIQKHSFCSNLCKIQWGQEIKRKREGKA